MVLCVRLSQKMLPLKKQTQLNTALLFRRRSENTLYPRDGVARLRSRVLHSNKTIIIFLLSFTYKFLLCFVEVIARILCSCFWWSQNKKKQWFPEDLGLMISIWWGGSIWLQPRYFERIIMLLSSSQHLMIMYKFRQFYVCPLTLPGLWKLYFVAHESPIFTGLTYSLPVSKVFDNVA